MSLTERHQYLAPYIPKMRYGSKITTHCRKTWTRGDRTLMVKEFWALDGNLKEIKNGTIHLSQTRISHNL